MPVPVIMPKLGMTMERGTIIKWLKRPGERVRSGEALLEIETDKSLMQVEAEASGVLLAIARNEGAEVPVTETIGWIGNPDEAVPGSCPATVRGPRVAATPAARRTASEVGVSLAAILGSGPLGAVTSADVRIAIGAAARETDNAAVVATSPLAAPPDRTRRPLTTATHFPP